MFAFSSKTVIKQKRKSLGWEQLLFRGRSKTLCQISLIYDNIYSNYDRTAVLKLSNAKSVTKSYLLAMVGYGSKINNNSVVKAFRLLSHLLTNPINTLVKFRYSYWFCKGLLPYKIWKSSLIRSLHRSMKFFLSRLTKGKIK